MARVQPAGTRTSRRAVALGALALVLGAGPLLWRETHLSPDQLFVDLDVYREAGRSVLQGRPVYWWLTPVPQLLPFTYPPVAALVALPLTLVPWQLLGWLWSLGQLALLAGIVRVAYRPLLQRLGPWTPAGLGALSAALVWMLPLSDGIHFGQVDILLVALCYADYVRRSERVPRGLLVGVAAAVKLTPGVFLVHLWLAGRRRAATVAVAVAVALTLGAFLVIPADSADYWFAALLDSNRIGDNAITSNQSLRGMLIRAGVSSPLPWLAAVAVVAVLGFRWAVRATRLGDDLAACALVGLLAVLLSPVAWIHHLAWLVLVLAVVVRDGRSRPRVVAAVLLWAFFVSALPWRGVTLLDPARFPGFPVVLARVVQDAYGLAALVLLPVLARLATRDAADRGGHDYDRSPSASAAVTRASAANNVPATRRTTATGTQRRSARPSTTASPATMTSATQEPTNTATGSS